MQLSETEIIAILKSIHPVMGHVVERLITEKNTKIAELARQLNDHGWVDR